ncbi:uncharacterized protein K02A2.6-like, partial [Aduncisulcus paluster]
MNIALGEEIGKSCVVYIDDVIIFGKNEKLFLENLERVLRKISSYGMILNKEKCVIGVKRCEYLGFIVSSEGRSIAKSRVDDLTLLREPRSKKDVRCLLGLLNFIRDFIPQCSILCSRFQELLRHDVPFIWTEDHSAAFKDIIRMLKEAPTLAFVDDKATLELYTDACDIGIGGILIQVLHGTRSVVLYISKALSDVQKRWSVYEKEAWGIIYC